MRGMVQTVLWSVVVQGVYAGSVVHSVGPAPEVGGGVVKSVASGVVKTTWKELVKAGSLEVYSELEGESFSYRIEAEPVGGGAALSIGKSDLLASAGGKPFADGQGVQLRISVTSGDVEFLGYTKFDIGSANPNEGAKVDGVRYMRPAIAKEALGFDIDVKGAEFVSQSIGNTTLRFVEFAFGSGAEKGKKSPAVVVRNPQNKKNVVVVRKKADPSVAVRKPSLTKSNASPVKALLHFNGVTLVASER